MIKVGEVYPYSGAQGEPVLVVVTYKKADSPYGGQIVDEDGRLVKWDGGKIIPDLSNCVIVLGGSFNETRIMGSLLARLELEQLLAMLHGDPSYEASWAEIVGKSYEV